MTVHDANHDETIDEGQAVPPSQNADNSSEAMPLINEQVEQTHENNADDDNESPKPPSKRQKIDIQQVLKDLDLENIDFDDSFGKDEPNNVRK